MSSMPPDVGGESLRGGVSTTDGVGSPAKLRSIAPMKAPEADIPSLR